MNKIKIKSAFGLVEVIISSTIIMIILGAIIFLSRNIISNAQFSAERFQALQIAQREIEQIRQIRDTNYIDEDPDSKWNSFLSGNATPVPGDFYAVKPIASGTTNYLKKITSPEKVESYPEASNIYNNQKYFRRVTFKNISGNSDTLLGKPQLKFEGHSIVPIPGYVVTVEVLWFNRQAIKYDVDGKPIYDNNALGAQAYDFDKLKKVTISEIITDNRPGY